MRRIGLALAIITAIVIGSAIITDQAQAQSEWAQITLQNNTPYTLDLYVDGNYGCRALPGMFCTTQIREGEHTFTATSASGEGSISEGPVYIQGGTSPTWTVYVEQQ